MPPLGLIFRNERTGKAKCVYCSNKLVPGVKRVRIRNSKVNHEIQQTIFCDAKYAIYLAECHLCQKQYVGSTVDFRQRLAKYKHNIRKLIFTVIWLSRKCYDTLAYQIYV